MCAIAGLWVPGVHALDGSAAAALRRQAQAMAEALAHRGPDGHGSWLDAESGVALAHRRLAIQGRGPNGHQPWVLPQGSAGHQALVYNGELYNAAELRAELAREGVVCRGPGDTEVLLRMLVQWGLARTLERLSGQYAFAWWEGPRRRLSLARDPFGQKPLVWTRVPGGVAFASTVAAFTRLPGFVARLEPATLPRYLAFGHVGPEASMLAGVQQVPPGQALVFDATSATGPQAPSLRRHWDLAAEVAQATAPAQRLHRLDEAREQLRPLVRAAVVRCAQAEVPVGAFLSGGIDSSLVCTQWQAAGLGPLRTWALGFDDADFDESTAAAAVARHLGAQHQTVRLDGAGARALLPTLVAAQDEPLADASLLPSLALAAAAREQVRVVLTGDGGDEAFGGYERYRQARGWVGALLRSPQGLRQAAAHAIGFVPPAAWSRLAAAWPAAHRPTRLAAKADKLARLLVADGAGGLHPAAWLQRWPLPVERLGHLKDLTDLNAEASLGMGWPGGPAASPALDLAGLDPGERQQLWETWHELPGDLLAKMDRATMWHGLEARGPLLEREVVRAAWRLAPSLKAAGGAPLDRGPALKRVLRSLLAETVPPALVERPKQGFSAPLARWLRGPLGEPAEQASRLALPLVEGWIAPQAVSAAWAEHRAGRADHADRLWTLAVLGWWQERWRVSS